jgi:hypothetical protein
MCAVNKNRVLTEIGILMGDKTIHITPDTLLMKHLGSSGHTLVKALSELVDNALDSFLENRDALKKLKQSKVKVSIQVERHQGVDRIIITDNAVGMSDEDLNNALTIARSAKPNSKVKELIGRFGMGMKTACSSLGMVFDIRTSRPDISQTHLVHYDEESFIKQKEWQIKLKTEPKSDKHTHGTTITITNLKKRPQAKSYLKENLSRIFAYYLRSGVLELTVQDDPVKPWTPELLTVKNAADLTKAPKPRERWSDDEVKELIARLKTIKFDSEGKKEFTFKIEGKEVKGWVGLQKHSSQRGNYGLSLIRHDRVVKEYAKIGFAEHPATARVVGEIHLDDWDVNYNKDDFVRDTEEWQKLEDAEEGPLHERISEVVAISRKMAVRKRDDLSESSHAEAEREGPKLKESIGDETFFDELEKEVVEESLKRINTPGEPQVIKPITARDAKDVQTKARASIEDVSSVRHELEKAGEGALYVKWETVHDGKKRILVVRTNADHPFFLSLPESFRKWYYAFLIAECYAEHVQKEIGYQSLALVKNIILAKQGPRLLSAIRSGKDEFNAKLEEHA